MYSQFIKCVKKFKHNDWKKTSAKFIPPDYIFEAILQKHIHTKVNVSKSDLVDDKKAEIEDNDQPQEIELELEVTEDNLVQKKDEEIET